VKMLVLGLYFTSRHRLTATKKKLFYAGMVVCVVETVGVVDFLLGYVNCFKVGEDWHPRVNMEAVCFDSVYSSYSGWVVYPLLGVFAVGLPAVMSMLIIKVKYVDEEAEQRMKAFVLGKSDDFVVDDHSTNDWFAIYYENFSGLVLLVIGNVAKSSQAKVVFFLVIFGSLVILARSKKLSFFKDARKHLFLVQRFVLFFTFVFGWINRGSVDVSAITFGKVVMVVGNAAFMGVVVWSFAENAWGGRREYKRTEEEGREVEIEMGEDGDRTEESEMIVLKKE